MKNHSLRNLLLVLLAFLLGYGVLYLGDQGDSRMQTAIYREMLRDDQSVRSLAFFSTQEVSGCTVVGFSYSSAYGDKLGCAVFRPLERGRWALYSLRCGDGLHAYRVAPDIYDGPLPLPVDGDYRLILSGSDQLGAVVTTDRSGGQKRYDVTAAPCLLLLDDVYAGRQYLDKNGEIIFQT